MSKTKPYLLIQRDQLGRPLPHQRCQILVGPEAVLPVGVCLPPAALRIEEPLRDVPVLPGLMYDARDHGERARDFS